MKSNQAAGRPASLAGQERNVAYIIVVIFVTSHIYPPAPVRCSGQGVVPFANMNMTIREHMRKHKFLNSVRNRLFQSQSSGKNSSTQAGPSRGTFTARSQQSPQFLPRQPPPNTSGAVRQGAVTPSLVPTMSPPNLIHSERIEKNVLTFHFRSNTVRNNSHVNRINLWLYVWTKDNKGKTPPASAGTSSPRARDLQRDDRPERRQGKQIKIRVFLSDASGYRGQRIAELKTRVDGSSWGKLGLPVSLIRSLLDSDTLRLRVECKRCSRKTQVLLPGSTDFKQCRKRHRMRNKKNKDKRVRRWRKHCLKMESLDEKLFPFIVIEEKSRGVTERFKRGSVDRSGANTAASLCPNLTTSGQRESANQSHLFTGSSRHCCTSYKNVVNFDALGLGQLIVYPSQLEFVSCIDGCSSASFLAQAQAQLDRVVGLVSRHILGHDVNPWRRPPLASHAHLTRSTTARDTKRSSPNRHRHRPTDHWHSHGRSRLKTALVGCHSADTRDLVMLYLSHENQLTRLELPNFLVTRCFCQGHPLPATRDQPSL